jgi:hypothetical protein
MTITKQTIIEAAEALGHPTNDAFAASLWRLSNCGSLPYDEAAQLMRDCGYIPFCGFPLTRSGRSDRLSRADAKRVMAENPLCGLTEEITIGVASRSWPYRMLAQFRLSRH